MPPTPLWEAHRLAFPLDFPLFSRLSECCCEVIDRTRWTGPHGYRRGPTVP